MSSEWQERPLEELVLKIGSGATPRGGKAVYRDRGVAFIRSQNVLDHAFSDVGLAYIDDAAAGALDGVKVQAGDVLLNITGDSVARCCMAPSGLDARVSQHVAIIRPQAQLLDGTFLAGYLLSPPVKRHLLQIAGAGGTRPALTKAHLAELAVPLPPLATQRGIAEVLNSFDGKIDAEERIAALCEDLAVAHIERSPRFAPLRDFADVMREQASPDDFANSNVAHFSLPAFDAARIPDLCSGATIKSNKFVLSTPVVLVSKLNPHIPRVWCALPPPGVMSVASTEFVVLRPRMPWSAEVLWAGCAAPSYVAALAGQVTGTTGSHQRVSPEDVLTAPIPDVSALPESTLKAVQSLVERAAAAREETRRLAALRDALLPPLIRGELWRRTDVA